MRKIFKDLSFPGVVLLLSVLYFGVLFRVISLSETSAWGDELASWYFANNLTNIFATESHTPVYYFICRIWFIFFPDTILSLRYLSIFLSFSLLVLSACLLRRESSFKAYLLFVLWWLWPTNLVYDRQARHYSLFADLTLLLLVMWHQKKRFSRFVFWSFLAFYQSLHPMALIPVIFLSSWDLFKSKRIRSFFFEISSALPLLIYYFARFMSQGAERVTSNIKWINNDTVTFLQSLLNLFLGDSYPFSLFYPVTEIQVLFLITLILITFFLRKGGMKLWENDQTYKFLILMFSTLAIVEVSSFVINLRISRYFIYLIPFFLFSLVQMSSTWTEFERRVRSFLLAVGLILFAIFLYKPWQPYMWDDQNVEALLKDIETLPSDELIVCANAFQLKYYFQMSWYNCSQEALRKLHTGESFYVFDLNGNDKYLVAYLNQKGKVTLFKKYNHSILIHVLPSEK